MEISEVMSVAKSKQGKLISASGARQENSKGGFTRRSFLKQPALAAAAAALAASPAQVLGSAQSKEKPARRPNIIIFHSDQFRWDCVCAAGHNPMDFTPNLDAMYRRGTVFQNFITNQPLCAPSRSCLMTGQYATTTGVWKNGPPLRADASTIATELTKAGYSANYIGKWHLAPAGAGPVPPEYRGSSVTRMEFAGSSLALWGMGAVPPGHRGGFTGLWVAANLPEMSTQPYNSQFWDNDGKAVHYGEDVYRVDFLTSVAENFLRQKHDKPFLLVISQLEPHQQNGPCGDDDVFGFVPPRGYAKRFRSPYVPPDLRALPGDWPYELDKYYGDIKSIDESLGRIFKTLKERNLDENTIVIFTSDHACHFRTRNQEYKRSPHESSIHVPLMIQGPGFNNAQIIPELVSMIDVTPSILDFLGLPVPSTMQGRSFIPLMHDEKARAEWPDEVLVQISESETARALRTREWTYVALAPDANPASDAGSLHYRDYQLYNIRADPAQLVNMAGRLDTRWPMPRLLHYSGERSVKEITEHLRQRLIERMVEAGEKRPQIDYWPYYP
jgi:arylsulfatase A-like enzyme